jgi:hypothetical protein
VGIVTASGWHKLFSQRFRDREDVWLDAREASTVYHQRASLNRRSLGRHP